VIAFMSIGDTVYAGSYQLLTTLAKYGIKFDIIAGTSMGRK
jgi:precorrin-2 methylase